MKKRILLVDDDVNILESYTRQFRKKFDVTTAENGRDALELLNHEEAFAVAVSDMQMPGMDGVSLLSAISEHAPDTVRIMLTGQADLKTAINAVNEGHIFRFLTKPCTAESLSSALNAGLEQYRLITAEKEVLEKTLRGSVEILIEMFSIANPTLFKRSSRIRRQARDIAAKLGMAGIWQIEIAAMLSQLGYISLPAELQRKVRNNETLTPEERELRRTHPDAAYKMLSKIPRLGAVACMVRDQEKTFENYQYAPGISDEIMLALGVQIIKTAADYEKLVALNEDKAAIMKMFRDSPETYNPHVVDALAALTAGQKKWTKMVLPVSGLKPGMITYEKIAAKNNSVIIEKGVEISDAIYDLILATHSTIGINEPLNVLTIN